MTRCLYATDSMLDVLALLLIIRLIHCTTVARVASSLRLSWQIHIWQPIGLSFCTSANLANHTCKPPAMLPRRLGLGGLIGNQAIKVV